MKKWLIGDILTYFIAPIIILAIFNREFKIYSIILATIIFLIYSIFIKANQSRINFSGILFSGVYILIQVLKLKLDKSFEIYVFDSYCLIASVIILLILDLLDKNIFKQLYIDLMKILNFSKIQIFTFIKKYKLYNDFNRLTYIVMIHLLILASIQFYSILTLGEYRYPNNLNIEVLICGVFLLIELILISKFVKNMKFNLSKNNMKSMKFTISESKVININKYKNTNK